MRLLIIEDEQSLQAQLKTQLVDKGFVIDVASDGIEGLYLGQEYPIDLAIVDIGLPKMSGIEVIKQWRKAEKTFPVLVLTARGQWQEKVEAFDVGADDYLVKPFHFEELLVRIEALLRRVGGWAQSTIESGPITLHLRKQLVTVADKELDLTAYEYKVLEYLMLHPGQIVSKSTLTDSLYAQDFDKDSNVIEVFVARLRKKLTACSDYQPIETLRGRGYRFGVKKPARTSASIDG